MRRAWIVAAAMALSLASTGLEGQSANPLVGVWRVGEIEAPQGEKNTNPQPTLYIFTARHYSHVSVTSSTPRPNYTGPNVTDAQRVEMWQPFSATAGTYEVRGNEFTIRPIVAKNPGFVAGGGFFTFEFTREGKDVWIRASQDGGGPIPRATTNRVKLIRLE
jgi:hypothetical protein